MRVNKSTLTSIAIGVIAAAIIGTGCSQGSNAPSTSTTSTAQTPGSATASSAPTQGQPTAPPIVQNHQGAVEAQTEYWLAHGQGQAVKAYREKEMLKRKARKTAVEKKQ